MRRLRVCLSGGVLRVRVHTDIGYRLQRRRERELPSYQTCEHNDQVRCQEAPQLWYHVRVRSDLLVFLLVWDIYYSRLIQILVVCGVELGGVSADKRTDLLFPG